MEHHCVLIPSSIDENLDDEYQNSWEQILKGPGDPCDAYGHKVLFPPYFPNQQNTRKYWRTYDDQGSTIAQKVWYHAYCIDPVYILF